MTETPHDTNVPTIAICIATYKRPKGLATLLESLQALRADDIQLHLIVADNDPTASSRHVVDAARERSVFPLHYVVEPTRGIPAARNRLVAEARKLNVDYIATVDDDETVDPNWINQLLATAQREDADVVAGKTIFEFDDDVPQSIRMCFKHMSLPLNPPYRHVSTANALYRMAIFPNDNPFNENLALTGGSDVLLSEQLYRRGAKITISPEAITRENVSGARITKGWILKRAYRAGVTTTIINKIVDPSLPNLATHLLKSVGRIVVGSGQVVISLVVDRESALYRARRVASGIGSIASLVTSRAVYHEYETISGE